jgi:hypothetical protein
VTPKVDVYGLAKKSAGVPVIVPFALSINPRGSDPLTLSQLL